MRILGIKSAPDQIRYAIIEGVHGNAKLQNAADENRLVFPNGTAEKFDERTKWLLENIQRILKRNAPIDCIAIKLGEFGPNIKLTKANRESGYYDAIAYLAAKLEAVPVVSASYKALGTTSKNVCIDAESEVGQTTTYWNAQMADAVIVALRTLK